MIGVHFSIITLCTFGLLFTIVWTADGLVGSFRVFKHKERYSWVGTSQWGHCFKYPGEYKTYLTAWKDNKIIIRQQLNISITNDKDFLVYNWDDINEDSHAWHSYADVLKSSPDLIISYGLDNTVPFAEVRLFSGEKTQSYHALYDYFNKLYSTPTYEDKIDKQKMRPLYNELFSEQKKYPNAYPIAIWVTERANIALLLLDNAMEDAGYIVYAEPNRL